MANQSWIGRILRRPRPAEHEAAALSLENAHAATIRRMQATINEQQQIIAALREENATLRQLAGVPADVVVRPVRLDNRHG